MSVQSSAVASGEPLGTRAQWVDARLREAILAGDLKPGERIRPVELAARWNVSPTPLREALFRMEADGLVQSIPHRGTRVTPLSRAAMTELYELRLVLEPLALRKAMAVRERVNGEHVRAAHATWLANHRSADPPRSEQAHRAFHRALLESCGSRWLLSLTDTMSLHSSRYRLLSVEPRGGWNAVKAEHRDLVQAFLAGHTEEAVALLTDHIGRTLDCVLLLPDLED